MTQPHAHEAKWGNAPGEFARHVATMPGWYKLVLALGVVLLIAGGAGWGVSRARQATPAPTVVAPAPARSQTPSGSSGFVGNDTAGRASSSDADAPIASPTTTTTASNPTDDLLSKISPHATRIGGSVLAGFLVGWLFRAFVKTMLFVALLAGAGLFALSYFGVVNVDFSTIQEHYADAAHWLASQGEKLKDVVVAHLPSTGAGSLGAYLGFRRR